MSRFGSGFSPRVFHRLGVVLRRLARMTMVEDVVAHLHATRAELLEQLDRVERALLAFNNDVPRLPDGSTAGASTAIVAALRLRGDAPANIGEILDGALSLGWRTASPKPRNVIASTVAKLARTGTVEKVAEGVYRLPESALADDIDEELLTA